MRRRNPTLSIDDHIVLGNRLKDARDEVRKLLLSLPPTSKPARDAVRVLKALGQLRCTLDSLLCAQVPVARDPCDLATFVYYGAERFGLHWYDPEELERDAFAPWTTVSSRHPDRDLSSQVVCLSQDR